MLDNFFDTSPPLIQSTSNVQNFYDQGITDSSYDAIGRQFRVGVRLHY